MADHFASLNRGEQGSAYVDFTTGAASTAGDKIELRVTDASMTKKDVILALYAFQRFIENPQQADTAGFVFLNN